MNHRLLPRSVFVPTDIIYHTRLPAAVLLTWIQLRALAWDGWVTPPLHLPDVLKLTHKSKNTLYSHLTLLEHKTNLRYHFTPANLLVISFQENNMSPSESRCKPPALANPPSAENSASSSYFPSRIMGYISYDETEDEDCDLGG